MKIESMTREEIENVEAKDITGMSPEGAYNLYEDQGLKLVGISSGKNGADGAVLISDNGDLFKVTQRNGVLLNVMPR